MLIRNLREADLELRHLRYFLTVAELGHVGRSAERLHVSQPALSQQIRDLEEELGAALFERHAKGVSLTPAGQAFLPHAQQAIQAAESWKAAVHGEKAGLRGSLVVGLPETQRALAIVQQGFANFQARFPGVTLSTSGIPWLQQPAALLERAVDVGFCWTGAQAGPSAYPRGVTGARLFEDPGEFALLPTDHPLAARDEITVTQLQKLPFALFDRSLHPPCAAMQKNALILTHKSACGWLPTDQSTLLSRPTVGSGCNRCDGVVSSSCRSFMRKETRALSLPPSSSRPQLDRRRRMRLDAMALDSRCAMSLFF